MITPIIKVPAAFVADKKFDILAFLDSEFRLSQDSAVGQKPPDWEILRPTVYDQMNGVVPFKAVT